MEQRNKNCPVCKKKCKRIYTHHVIPRYISISSDEDTVEVCQGCHAKMENIFKNLLLWGNIEIPRWLNKSKQKKRQKQWVNENRERVTTNQRERCRRNGKHLYTWFKYKDRETIKNQITNLYWRRKLTIREISKIMKITTVTLRSWMIQLNIARRTKSEAMKLAFQMRDKNEPKR